MIGTGVFTTTGLLVRDLGSPIAVMLAWAVGGVAAICGALAYGQLGAALPDNGGEYRILSRLYHPAVGFTAGFVSMVVGFSAPIAASAIAFGLYVERLVPGVPALAAAVALVLVMSALHAAGVSLGARVQNALTLSQVVLIAVLIVAALLHGDAGRLTSPGPQPLLRTAVSPVFAVGILYVSFSYSGWNAAVYVAGEVRRPYRTLPVALAAGTAAVVVLYLGLNLAFLVSAPTASLSGVVEIGHVAASALFGRGGAAAVSVVIALGLASTVGAVILTGARVLEAMGRDYALLGSLSFRREGRGPLVAVCAQATLALVMMLTASFDALLAYMGFTLTLSSALCIAALFRLPHAQRATGWGHPVTTVLALVLMIWMMGLSVTERPRTVAWSGATIATGLALYGLVRRWTPHQPAPG
jgi:APA family basic amino acid/polyamine antiporter